MNVIIVTVILLIVLVVVLSIFVGRSKIFSKEISECKGECLEPINGKCPNSDYAKISGECSDNQSICCLDLG